MIFKRIFDFVASSLGLVILSPVMICIALAILMQRDGPVLLRQVRLGQNEKPFTLIKFRTMAVGTPVAGTHEVHPRHVTTLGARLRRWKIDELPQLWNVLTGDMSLVGPRPCLPVQQELVAARRLEDAFLVKPGITGPAQIVGVDMSEPQRLAALDGEYVQSRSFAGDLRILFLTVATIVRARK